MKCIWHISDLHFRPGSDFDGMLDDKEDLGEDVLRQITEARRSHFLTGVRQSIVEGHVPRPDVVVVSGDLISKVDDAGNPITPEAAEAGLKMAREFLKALIAELHLNPLHLVLVPGNHDVDRAAFSVGDESERMLRVFRSIFFSEGHTTPHSPNPHLTLSGLFVKPFNSCGLAGIPLTSRIKAVSDCLRSKGFGEDVVEDVASELRHRFVEDAGLISLDQLEALDKEIEQLEKDNWETCFRIAVLHHHLSAFPKTEVKPFETVMNAGNVKSRLNHAGFDLVLHGHKHFSNVTFEQDVKMGYKKGMLYVGAPLLFDSNITNFVVIELTDEQPAAEIRISLATMDPHGPPHLLTRRIATLPQRPSAMAETRYFSDESSIGPDLYQLALHAKEIDVLAIRGRYLLTNEDRWFAKAFQERNHPAQTRLLLLDTNSTKPEVVSFVRERAISHKEPMADFKNEGLITLRYLAAMAFNTKVYGESCFGENLHVRLYRHPPIWRMIRIDDTVYVHYFYRDSHFNHVRGKNLSGFIATRSGRDSYLYHAFAGQFEKMWKWRDNDKVGLSQIYYSDLPSLEDMELLLDEFEASEDLRLHCFETAERARFICEEISKHQPDTRLHPEVVELAAFVHDIGRAAPKTSQVLKEQSIDIHSAVSHDILLEHNHLSLANVVLTHSLAGIDAEEAKAIGLPYNQGLMPSSLEEKVLILADKMEPGRDTPESVIESFLFDRKKHKWFYRYAPTLRDNTQKRFQTLFAEFEDMGFDFEKYRAFIQKQQRAAEKQA